VRVPLERVPLGVWRLAARHLESIRGAPLAQGAEGAMLGPEVYPLSRPDIRGVAYWEFEILGLKRRSPKGVKGPRVGTGTGFIVVSAGRHDVPIPHWSLDRNPPSRALEQRFMEPAGASPVAAVYRVDALCYLAEGADRNYLGHLGQFPPLVQFPAAALKRDAYPGSLTAAAARGAPTDKGKSKLSATTTGRKPPNAKMQHWESWAKAKQGYTTAFAKQLAAQKARAAPRWQIEDLLAKFGQGIHAGTSLVVPLLKAGKASLAGDGAKLIRMGMVDRPGAPAVELNALDSETKGEMHFTLELSYADGTTESLPYFVVPSGTPSNEHPPGRPVPVPVPPVRPAAHPVPGPQG
jgi:hypothetical protein